MVTSGVQKKIIAKIKALNELDCICDGISLAPNIPEEKKAGYFTVIPYQNKYRGKYFKRFHHQMEVYNALITWLKKEYKQLR